MASKTKKKVGAKVSTVRAIKRKHAGTAKPVSLVVSEIPVVEPVVAPQAVQAPPVALPVSDVRLSPELQDLATKAAQARPAAGPADGDREKARLERLQRKAQENEELRRRREAAEAAPLPPMPLPAAISQIAVPPSLKPGTNGTPGSNGNHLTIQIPETLRYKVLLAESEYQRLATPIRQALKHEAEMRLMVDIKNAIEANIACREAANKMNAAVNEILDTVEPSMPDGYAGINVATKDGVVVCKHAPEMRGKRLRLV